MSPVQPIRSGPPLDRVPLPPPTRPLRAYAENAALAAALAVPLVFSIFTERIFEAEKAGLIRVLGVVALIGAAAYRPLGRSAVSPIAAGPHRLLAAAMVALLASEALATVFSVSPITSLFGSFDRAQGLVTTAALVALAAAAAMLAARPSGPARLADAIGLAVLPAGLYALVQRAGLDPIPWAGDVVTRVSGPSGSSTLFAAHLAVALPFTALGVARAWRAAVRDVNLAIRILTLAIGLVALVLSGSRGPALGVATGAAVAGLAIAGMAGRRREALGVAAAVFGGVAIVIALNRSPAAFGPLADLPLVDRLSTALDPEKSTTRVRIRLWEGSVEALASNPGSLPLGFGPETMDLVWAPYYPSILAYDEPRGWVPDRAHSVGLDTLLTYGAAGLIAFLTLLGAAAITCLDVIGLASTPGRRRGAAASMLVGGLACGAAAGVVDGAWRLVAPASGIGLVAGLMAWLTAAAWRRADRHGAIDGGRAIDLGRTIDSGHAIDAGRTIDAGRAGDSGHAIDAGRTIDAGRVGDWSRAIDADRTIDAGRAIDVAFALAALGALTAHFVELQVSFAVSATRTIIFIVCGALFGIASRRTHGLGIAAATSQHRSPGPASFDARTAIGDERGNDARLMSSIVALTLIYAFARPGLAGGAAPIAAALISFSTIGVLVALADGTANIRRAVWHVALVVSVYSIVQITVLAALTEGPEEAAAGAAVSLALFVTALLALIATGAVLRPTADDRSSGRTSDPPRDPPDGPRGNPAIERLSDPPRDPPLPARRLAIPLTALIALVSAFPLWILPSTADALQKEGRLVWEAPIAELRAHGESGRAESMLGRARERYARAAALAPTQARHALAEAFAAEVHGDIVSERLDRAAARAGLGEVLDAAGGEGEYDPALLDGDAARWAEERDSAFRIALGHIERADRLMGPSPTPPIARARALRVWAERTRGEKVRAERLESAAAAYQIAIAAAPRWPEIREEAARTALLKGRPAEAITFCTDALAIDRYYSRCHATRARAHMAAGDVAAAAQGWAEYFEDSRNTGDADSRREQLRALFALDRNDAALDTARDILRLAPGDARTHADLAVILERAGDLEAARESAAAAARLAPNDQGIKELVERLRDADD